MNLSGRINILILGLLSLIPARASCQNFTIRSYTTSQGLPHNNVRSLALDSTGFLWIATWDGLSRFDGYEFRNYFHRADDSLSIPFFSILKAEVDRKNNLCILSDDGKVALYNRVRDNFTVLIDPGDSNLSLPIGFSVSNTGDLFTIQHDQLTRWNGGVPEQMFRLVDNNNSKYIPDQSEISVYNDKRNHFYLTTLNKVARFSYTGNDTLILDGEYPIIRPNRTRIIDFEINPTSHFYISESGAWWIFSNQGLYRFNNDKGEFYEVKKDIPLTEFKGQSVFYWSSWDYGVSIYYPESEKLTKIPFDESGIATAILPAGNNALWFSGSTKTGVPQGLRHLIYTPDYFRNYIIMDPDSALPAIYSVIMDRDKNIWTGIRGYDNILLFMRDGSGNSTGKLSSELYNISGHIRKMVPCPDGIWIGYFIGLLRFYDYKTRNFREYFPAGNGFRAIASAGDGNVYTGGGFLAVFNPSTGKSDTLWYNSEPQSMFTILPLDDTALFVTMGRSKVLNYNLKSRSGSLISFGRLTVNIEDVVIGKDGQAWFATLGEGICKYNLKTGSSTFFTTSEGLSNNVTYNLLEDRKGNIWVSTNEGISRINPVTGNIRRFGPTDGLKISEFNSGAKFETEDGEFIFGGMGGFVRFHPDSIFEADAGNKSNNIILTGFEVSGEPRFLTVPLNECDTIKLNKGETNFYFSFSTTDFVNVNKTRFRYKLSGINESWIETGPNNRNINYSNLSPGWYKIEIGATDAERQWVMSKSVVIRIQPYFYETPVFLITAPVLILVIILFSIFTYIRQIKVRAKQIQDELKLQSLRGQMNPHFIFNSLNSINYFISNNDKISANRYIADFSRLIRSILSNLGTDYVSMENELTTIRDYLNIEHLRFSDKFDYEINTTELRYSPCIEVFPGLVQPFIENAIWHGVRLLEREKGFIRIKFSDSDPKKIKCVIEDNGAGRIIAMNRRSVDSDHKSRGIGIVMERLQLISKLSGIDYELIISDLYPGREETGTRVEIDIPVR